MHGNPQSIRGQTDLLRLLLQGKGGQRKTFQRFAVAPLPGHILLRAMLQVRFSASSPSRFSSTRIRPFSNT